MSVVFSGLERLHIKYKLCNLVFDSLKKATLYSILKNLIVASGDSVLQSWLQHQLAVQL